MVLFSHQLHLLRHLPTVLTHLLLLLLVPIPLPGGPDLGQVGLRGQKPEQQRHKEAIPHRLGVVLLWLIRQLLAGVVLGQLVSRPFLGRQNKQPTPAFLHDRSMAIPLLPMRPLPTTLLLLSGLIMARKRKPKATPPPLQPCSATLGTLTVFVKAVPVLVLVATLLPIRQLLKKFGGANQPP